MILLFSVPINSRGWVTGQSLNGITDPVLGSPEYRAVLWKGNEIVDLGTLGGHSFVIGIHVNDSGQVVGISDNGVADPFSIFGIGVQLRTFLWQDGAIQDIGSLGGPDTIPGASCRGQPHDVVVGASYTSFTPNASTGIPTIDPFLWKSGQMTDLGTLGGASGSAQCANHRGQIACSRSLGLNARGQVVGKSTDYFNALHAFVWEEGGPMWDLNTLIAAGSGRQLARALNINDRGEILVPADPVGVTPTDDDDLGHLVLLVPCDIGEAGCEESPSPTTNSAPIHPTRINNLPTTAQLTPRQKTAALRARLARQYHGHGAPKN